MKNIQNNQSTASNVTLEIDSLQHQESDSFARRIFITYTTHIPWMIGRLNRPTKEDEACYKANIPAIGSAKG